MKKLVLAIALLIFVAASAEIITVTTNAVTVYPPATLNPVWVVSVVNRGTNTIFLRRNISSAALVASNAIPLRANSAYNSPTPGEGKMLPASQVSGVSLVTTNGTAEADVGFDN